MRICAENSYREFEIRAETKKILLTGGNKPRISNSRFFLVSVRIVLRKPSAKISKSFDIIPEESRPKTDKESKAGTVTVWDLNAKGWRSFRYDRITKVEEQKIN